MCAPLPVAGVSTGPGGRSGARLRAGGGRGTAACGAGAEGRSRTESAPVLLINRWCRRCGVYG